MNLEKTIEEIRNDEYSLSILRLLYVNPNGLSVKELKTKLGREGRGYLFRKLGDLEIKGLIKKSKIGRKAIRTITPTGINIVVKAEAEKERVTPEIIKREYGFDVGTEGTCNAIFYLSFGSVDAKQHITDELAIEIEKLAEKLLEKSVDALEEKERFKAWVHVDLQTDELNEGIILFRDDLFELRNEIEKLTDLWHKEYSDLCVDKTSEKFRIGTYLWQDVFFFEATLARDELKKRGINLSSFHQLIEIKWPIIPKEIKTIVEEGTYHEKMKERVSTDTKEIHKELIYKPNFRFLINNEVVDLSQAFDVRSFFEDLKDPIIRKWIERNRDKDGMDQWFEGIPWDNLGFPANEDTDREFIENEEPRYLLHGKEPESLSDSHLRFVFHMLKRTPIEIGTERWFREVEHQAEWVEKWKKEEVSDYMIMTTYRHVRMKHELERFELPIDLKNSIEFYAHYDLPGFPKGFPMPLPRLRLLVDPTLKLIFQQMRENKPRENPLVDIFFETVFLKWESEKRPETWRDRYRILTSISKIAEEYKDKKDKGLNHKDALKKAVDREVYAWTHG